MYGHLTFVREPEFLHLFDVSANLNRHNIVGTETRPSQNILQWHIDCFALKLLKKCASQEGSSDAPLFPWKQNLSWESEFSTFWRQRTSQRWNSGRGGYIQKSYFNSLPKVQPHLDSSLIKLPKPKCCCPVTNLTSHKFIWLSKSYKSCLLWSHLRCHFYETSMSTNYPLYYLSVSISLWVQPQKLKKGRGEIFLVTILIVDLDTLFVIMNKPKLHSISLSNMCTFSVKCVLMFFAHSSARFGTFFFFF